jgi:serpin B
MNRNKIVVRSIVPLTLICFLSSPRHSMAVAPMEKTEQTKALAADCNLFAADLYARLRGQPAANLFCSPYSISLALAMTYAGAEGDTAAQMATVLHLDQPKTDVLPAFGALGKLLAAGDKNSTLQLRVANRLWGQQGFHFLPAFLEETQANFGAELGLLDFKQSEAARKTINDWVARQTEDKIRDLIGPGVVDGETRLVLTNAIYFKARWSHEFSKPATADAPFHTSAAAEVAVPTMHQTHRLRHAAMDELAVLELPYGQDKSLAMFILLPDKIDGLAALEKRLTDENLQKWLGRLQPKPVKVALPRFKITAEFSLGDTLAAMGMPLAFSAKADFSGMSTEQPLRISAVIHKAFVDVNEEGTEAAAATAVSMKAMALPPSREEPIEFRADHPFVFLIRERQTQSILFVGRLATPRKA